ncbi:hypothetical protein [Bradyrhizobium genosp. L]|uniref:hypothetical protein n=1 Tax=Bradyrhizobium genosp. L TaxID=83637 RepID=UPI0024C0D286|nr:hypothetical protein [Bradyrhizobium genosp. L]
MQRVVRMRGVFLGLLFMGPFGLMIDLGGLDRVRSGRRNGGFERCNDGSGLGFGVRRHAHAMGVIAIVVPRIVVMMMLVICVIMMMVVMVMVIMVMIVVAVIVMVLVIMGMPVRMVMTLVSGRIVIVMLGIDRMIVCLDGLQRLGIGARALDHLALHALAMTAATGIAVARTAAVAAVLVLFLGLAMGALVGLDQRLTVGDRDLVVVGMDFAEGEEAVPVAAILDEGGLQRRFDARDLGEIDIAAQLLALGGLEIKLFDAIAADHDDPGLFRVGGIDQHLVGHFGALGGGGRGAWRAQIAPPGDATVHLIRG